MYMMHDYDEESVLSEDGWCDFDDDDVLNVLKMMKNKNEMEDESKSRDYDDDDNHDLYLDSIIPKEKKLIGAFQFIRNEYEAIDMEMYDVLLEIMKENPNLEQVQCDGLVITYFQSRLECQIQHLVDRDVGTLALKIMKLFPNNVEVQVSTCCIMARLSLHTPTRINLVKTNAVDEIMSCMRRYSMDSSVQASGCNALSNLTHGIENVDDAALSSKMIEVILSALDHHKASSDVQEFAIGAISNVFSTLNIQDLSIKMSAVQLTLNAMNNYNENIEIQRNGLWMFQSLLPDENENETLRTKIIEAGVAELAIEKMKKYKYMVGLQDDCCYLLRKLAISERNRYYLMQLNITEIIKDIMQIHSGNTLIQETGIALIGNLAINSEHHGNIIQNGLPELILSSMSSHKNIGSVQWSGCYALYNLSRNQENVSILSDLGMVEAVLQSKLHHPNESNTIFDETFTTTKLVDKIMEIITTCDSCILY